MVIFNSYVKLPEGIPPFQSFHQFGLHGWKIQTTSSSGFLSRSWRSWSSRLTSLPPGVGMARESGYFLLISYYIILHYICIYIIYYITLYMHMY